MEGPTVDKSAPSTVTRVPPPVERYVVPKGPTCNEPKAWMNVPLNKMGKLVFVGDFELTEFLISFFLPQAWGLSKTVDSLLDLPDGVGLDKCPL